MTSRLILALIVGAVVLTPAARAETLVCAADGAQRRHCPADVSGGVALTRSTGQGACLLGRSWGYDDAGVWVTDGCAAEFTLGRSTQTAATPAAPVEAEATRSRVDAWKEGDSLIPPEKPNYGALDSNGQGITLYEGEKGQVALSAYALVRYIDQRPSEQTFEDHLGRERTIDTRRDVQFHRAMVHLKGWFYSPKLRYQVTTWTVMSTDQTTLYGFLGYQFNDKFNLYGGISTTGGSRSLMGSHPLWLANDRVMADEYFRGSFTGTLWANGEVMPGLWYQVALGNNLSQLGITAKQLTRDMSNGVMVWWMPTTHEFGPQGAYGDWEYHETLATRFGLSRTRSRENRQELSDNTPENTQVRLADSVLLFDTGSLAPGVTVGEADWESMSLDLGFKYRGFFFQAEFYKRWLDHFAADGPLPVSEIEDEGFYVQTAFFPIKQKLELYAATSWIFGDEDAGFGDSHEWILGANLFPWDTRKARVNFQVINVEKSAVNSTFGFYVGGQTGFTYSVAASLLF